MQTAHQDQQTITLESDDGRSYACRLIGVFEFDNRDYALLLNLDIQKNEADKEDAAMVIMQFIERESQTIFRTIENDEEFRRVVTFVKGLAAENAASDPPETF
jgi:uncharacterized protein YrzB (UPF0473 family)